MNCKKTQKNLIFYINNELEKELSEKIKKHTDNCKTCSKAYEELKATLSLTEKTERLKPNPFLYTRIKQKLEEQNNKKKIPGFSINKILQPLIMSLLLILGISGGIKIGNMYETKQQKQNIISQTTEYYLNDFEQEKIELILLNE